MGVQTDNVSNLETFSSAPLKSVDGSEIVASDLWSKQPALIICIRRPGCILCREEAQKVYAKKAEIEAAGVRLVAIVHEWIDREIAAFHPTYWGGELYHDKTKAMYTALHGGKILRGSLLTFLNPFAEVWKNGKRAKETVKESNLKGDGLTMGGLMLMRQGDGGVEYAFQENTFGSHAPLEDVLAACKRVGAAHKNKL